MPKNTAPAPTSSPPDSNGNTAEAQPLSIPVRRCLVCGHEWIPRQLARPQRCANRDCGSRNFDREVPLHGRPAGHGRPARAPKATAAPKATTEAQT